MFHHNKESESESIASKMYLLLKYFQVSLMNNYNHWLKADLLVFKDVAGLWVLSI